VRDREGGGDGFFTSFYRTDPTRTEFRLSVISLALPNSVDVGASLSSGRPTPTWAILRKGCSRGKNKDCVCVGGGGMNEYRTGKVPNRLKGY